MKDTKQQWFKEAKLGMFIHWGLYSLLAGEYGGKKTDGLRKNPGVSAVFVDHSEIDGPKLTTRYGCAMVFGEAEEILDAGEKEEALRLLCLRFAPEHMDEFERSQGSVPRTSIWKITVKHITGKANR